MPGCPEYPNRPAACGTAALGCASSAIPRPRAGVPHQPVLRPMRGGLFPEGKPMPVYREILDALPQKDDETDPKVDELCRTGPARHEGKMKVILLPTSGSAPSHPAADTPCTPHPQGPAICVARPHARGRACHTPCPAESLLNRPGSARNRSACRLCGSRTCRTHGGTTPKAVRKPLQTCRNLQNGTELDSYLTRHLPQRPLRPSLMRNVCYLTVISMPRITHTRVCPRAVLGHRCLVIGPRSSVLVHRSALIGHSPTQPLTCAPSRRNKEPCRPWSGVGGRNDSLRRELRQQFHQVSVVQNA